MGVKGCSPWDASPLGDIGGHPHNAAEICRIYLETIISPEQKKIITQFRECNRPVEKMGDPPGFTPDSLISNLHAAGIHEALFFSRKPGKIRSFKVKGGEIIIHRFGPPDEFEFSPSLQQELG